MPWVLTRGERRAEIGYRVAGFISERWPASNRNGGRHRLGTGGRHASESVLDWVRSANRWWSRAKMGQRRRAGIMLDPLGLSAPALVGNSFASDEKGRCAMHVRILLQITADDGAASLTEEVTAFEKSAERPEDLGLSLAEGKAVTAAIQRHVVNAQVASWTERHRGCE